MKKHYAKFFNLASLCKIQREVAIPQPTCMHRQTVHTCTRHGMNLTIECTMLPSRLPSFKKEYGKNLLLQTGLCFTLQKENYLVKRRQLTQAL